jgi:hypothetical protein
MSRRVLGSRSAVVRTDVDERLLAAAASFVEMEGLANVTVDALGLAELLARAEEDLVKPRKRCAY